MAPINTLEFNMKRFAALPFALTVLLGAAHSQSMDSRSMDHANHGAGHAAHAPSMAENQRQAEVAQRGGDVMPFELSSTTHFFSRSVHGGVQQVVAKHANDPVQVRRVREHLETIRRQFLSGDYSGPSHIHGQDMPGLAALTAAAPGQIEIAYREVAQGAELSYTVASASLVTALHQWFDAQLSDHGEDAQAGHSPIGGVAKSPQGKR